MNVTSTSTTVLWVPQFYQSEESAFLEDFNTARISYTGRDLQSGQYVFRSRYHRQLFKPFLHILLFDSLASIVVETHHSKR